MSIKQKIVVKSFTGSGWINFEEDRKESLGEVNNPKALSDQVTKLQSLEDEIDEQEKKLKELKRNKELLSGEVIPTMMTEMIKDNREMRKCISEIVPKIGNTIIHNNNNQFNMNVFLNEHCKNAICLEDFIKNLQLTLQDVSKTSQLGFTEGVSNILIKNLNDLPVIQRPIHCSDV